MILTSPWWLPAAKVCRSNAVQTQGGLIVAVQKSGTVGSASENKGWNLQHFATPWQLQRNHVAYPTQSHSISPMAAPSYLHDIFDITLWRLQHTPRHLQHNLKARAT